MLPRTLKNMNVFVEGLGYAGRIKECEPPEIKIKLEKYRAGGMDGEAEVDMGMEAMKAKMSFAEMMADVLKRVALSDTEGTRVTMRGAIRRNAEDAVPVVIVLAGSFDSATLGKWKSGEEATQEIEMSVKYYKLTIGDDFIWEIDVDSCVRRIGDKDVMSTIRAAIGI